MVHFEFKTGFYYSDDYCLQSNWYINKCIETRNNTEVLVKLGEEAVKSCGVIITKSGKNQDDQIYLVVCNVVGDSVVLKGDERVVVREVIVFGSSKERNHHSFKR